MGKRIVVGVGLAAALLALVYLHGVYIQVAVVLVALAVQYEMIKTIKTSGVKPVEIVLYAFTALALPGISVYGRFGGRLCFADVLGHFDFRHGNRVRRF